MRAPRTTMLSEGFETVAVGSEDIGIRLGPHASPSAAAQSLPRGLPNLSIIKQEKNVARAPRPPYDKGETQFLKEITAERREGVKQVSNKSQKCPQRESESFSRSRRFPYRMAN